MKIDSNMTSAKRKVVAAILGATAVPALALSINGAYAGSVPNACTLIPKAAADRILGSKVTIKPIETYGAPVSHCLYSAAHNGGFSLLIGRVQYKSAAAELARQKRTSAADWPPGMARPSFTDVKGLGEAATVLKGQGFFQLHVLYRGNSVVINMNHQATAAKTAQARQLAGIALKKLH